MATSNALTVEGRSPPLEGSFRPSRATSASCSDTCRSATSTSTPSSPRRPRGRRRAGDVLGGARRPVRPSGRHALRVARDIESADVSGVAGTPTFFVNGRRHYGPYDEATLLNLVRESLTTAGVLRSP